MFAKKYQFLLPDPTVSLRVHWKTYGEAQMGELSGRKEGYQKCPLNFFVLKFVNKHDKHVLWNFSGSENNVNDFLWVWYLGMKLGVGGTIFEITLGAYISKYVVSNLKICLRKNTNSCCLTLQSPFGVHWKTYSVAQRAESFYSPQWQAPYWANPPPPHPQRTLLKMSIWFSLFIDRFHEKNGTYSAINHFGDGDKGLWVKCSRDKSVSRGEIYIFLS